MYSFINGIGGEIAKEIAEALEASNSEGDLRRFEELMEKDVVPRVSYEEFSERYIPVGLGHREESY
ncbi:hypothetical protein [Halorubrum ezzemoulense]|uniref:hypothetical protein n=1 Tax=Halorubrum ezzemoulense TaxID=337243 RepID=UPI00111BD96C|nr:hypothetical protein [Halorubrum ezzemoulense]